MEEDFELANIESKSSSGNSLLLSPKRLSATKLAKIQKDRANAVVTNTKIFIRFCGGTQAKINHFYLPEVDGTLDSEWGNSGKRVFLLSIYFIYLFN